MPKLVVALVILFLWAAGRDLDALARFSITSDYYVLSLAGLGPLFFLMGGAVLLSNVSAVYFLFRPARVGIKVLYGALGLGMMQNAVTVWLALRDLPGVREAYARGREIRGLAVREEAMDLIFAPGGMIAAVVAMVAFYLLVAALVHKSRRYFQVDGEIAV
ncbi:MAG: hypothetical protein U1A22_01865 [Xanthomonadaceae bacterium]|nr:hypothetical protein [Xanthomonadaceae bacterium]